MQACVSDLTGDSERKLAVSAGQGVRDLDFVIRIRPNLRVNVQKELWESREVTS